MTPAFSITPKEPPPSYDASISSPPPTQNTEECVPQGKKEDKEQDIPDFEPPPFSLSPITLTISPKSHLIDYHLKTAAVGSSTPKRALYELTNALDGHSRNVGIVEILPSTNLRPDGRCKEFKEKQILYHVIEYPLFPHNPRCTAISAQNKKLIQGTILTKCVGFGPAWEARSHGVDWRSENTLLYTAKHKSKGILEWKDEKGAVVAMETCTGGFKTDREELEILVPLEKKMLDVVVAVWVARIFHEVEKLGKKEDKEDEKRRKEEQKVRDAEEGKPHGVLHDRVFILPSLSCRV
jgi:hypothetical protein